MYKDLLIPWLQNQKIDFKINRDEVQFKCPSGTHQDKNPSFSANITTGLCYCFSCGFSTHLNKLLDIKQDDDMIRNSKYLSLNAQWEVPEEDEPPNILLPPVDFYIKESIRGIPRELLEELEVYYCSYGRYKGRLIFPIRDVMDNLVGFDARIYEYPERPDIVPEVPEAKYLRPTNMKTSNILYPINYLRDSELDTTTVILTEGIFDALSYISLGYAAVCNFGLGTPSSIKISQLLSIGTENIMNGFDNDIRAIKAWQGDIENGKLGLKRVWADNFRINRSIDLIRNLEYKDINEYLQNLKQG